MASKPKRLSRDVTGPSPHSVAILEKTPLRRQADYLRSVQKRKEEERERATAIVDYCLQSDLKASWIISTDKKILRNTIQCKVDSILQKQNFSLVERQERLHDLIMKEDEEYLSEMLSREDTPLEKLAKMRERAHSLRDKRERERLAVVEEKLDQRWRSQCEDLRGIEIKRRQNDIEKQRREQLRLKDEEQKRKEEEEALYAQMWQADHMIKCQREEIEETLQIERNKEMLDLLNMQMSAKQEEKDALKILQEKEAELLQEEAALRAMEDERRNQDKRQKQEESRMCLDHSLKIKMKRKAKEVQQELALDMKILEEMLKATTNESMENLQRKIQLREEALRYKRYLEEHAKEEQKHEKELDAIITSEVEKQWSKRLQQWKRERQARKQLMQHVMDTRKQQLEEKLAEVAKQKDKMEKDRKELVRIFEEHQKIEKRHEEEKKQVALSYQNDLLEQMKYLDTKKQQQQQQLEEELTQQKEAEMLYKRRVQDALDKPDLSKAPRHCHYLGISNDKTL